MSFQGIRLDIESDLSFLRSVHRVLAASLDLPIDEDEEAELRSWIGHRNLDAIRTWLRLKNTEELTIRELRWKASRLGIKKYGRMSKANLLSEIAVKEQLNGLRAFEGSGDSDFGEDHCSKASA